MEELLSLKNPKIKAVLALDKSRERKKTGRIKIEGIREIELAVQANVELDQLFYCPAQWEESELEGFLRGISAEHIPVAEHVMEKVCYRGNVRNALAVARSPKSQKLEDVRKGKYLVVEGIEKPGNLGAILRTADASGIDGILLVNAPLDLYNPNVIRASLGAVFSVPVSETTSRQALEQLKKEGFKIFTTFIENAKKYYEVSRQGNVAVVVGSEAFGVSDIWRDQACANVVIPMHGQVNSMNISVAAALLMYEMMRL